MIVIEIPGRKPLRINHVVLEVRYRPTYNLKEGRFTRADSYMRIFIQGIGLVGAAEFMPIAEDSGQIRAIGYYALDHAGRCISELMNTGREFDSIFLTNTVIWFPAT